MAGHNLAKESVAGSPAIAHSKANHHWKQANVAPRKTATSQAGHLGHPARARAQHIRAPPTHGHPKLAPSVPWFSDG